MFEQCVQSDTDFLELGYVDGAYFLKVDDRACRVCEEIACTACIETSREAHHNVIYKSKANRVGLTYILMVL